MIKIRRHLFTLAIALFTTSGFCQLVTMTNLHMPTFEGKGEAKVGIGYCYLPEIRVAYTPTDHLFITATVAQGLYNKTESAILNSDKTEVIGTYEHRARRTFYQLGAGYFNKYKRNRVFEIQGGLSYGVGQTTNSFIYTNGIANETRVIDGAKPFAQAFIQPAIGKSNRIFGWAFGYKLSTFVVGGDDELAWVHEPIYSMSFGWEKLRIEPQIGFRLATSDWSYRYIHRGIGINYRIGKPAIPKKERGEKVRVRS